METYTIGEAVARSGFSASTLRYYERIGLVVAPARTESGYRTYDDRTLARLGFIARAKQLGCTLEEISGLVELWDGDRCDPVQRRLHELVTGKIDATQAQVAELTTFASQLRDAATRLCGEPVDGPCGDDCACSRSNERAADPPIACTLDFGAMGDRLDDWAAVLGHAVAHTESSGGALRIAFDDGLDIADLARLVEAEQRCCAFFAFAITIDAAGVALEVRAPSEAADVVVALLSGDGRLLRSVASR